MELDEVCTFYKTIKLTESNGQIRVNIPADFTKTENGFELKAGDEVQLGNDLKNKVIFFKYGTAT
jgi:uncharacterized Zn ribbon protein